MAKEWHRKHISTKWGIGILGILILGLVIFITQVGQSQNLSSRAASRFFGSAYYVYFPPPGNKTITMFIGKNTLPVYIVKTNGGDYTIPNMNLNIFFEKEYFNNITFTPNYPFKSSYKIKEYGNTRGDKYISIDITNRFPNTPFKAPTRYHIGNLKMTATRITPGSYETLFSLIPYGGVMSTVKLCDFNNNNNCSQFIVDTQKLTHTNNKYPISSWVVIEAKKNAPPVPKTKKLEDLPL